MATPNSALQQYQQVGAQSGVAYASPHRLVQMLLEGVFERIATAKGYVQRQDIPTKGDQISKAIGIVGGLREALNLEAGGELAANLDALYDYIQRRLLEANLHSDDAILDEVADLLRPIKEGWDAIANSPEANAPPSPVDAPA